MRKPYRAKTAQISRSRGMSLIELLVAAAIGLIATIAIFQVFAVFEGQKRTTTSGGEAQINGTLAMFALERELRQGGYGMNSIDYLGCNILAWDELAGATVGPLTFVPVRITQGAGSTPGVAGAPDTISVMYGNSDLLTGSTSISQNMANPMSTFQVINRYGFQEGDLVIAAETGKDCTLAQVTGLPLGGGAQQNVDHNTGNYTDPDTGVQTASRYNKPAGLGVSYTTNAKLFNIGPLPASNVYSVQNGQLMLQQMLSAPSAAATALYDGIVQLQAQYGRDTTGDGVIDVFDEFAPASAADWATVLAVRVAVIARSGQYEKTEVSPATIKLWEDCLPPPALPPCNPPYTTAPVWTLTADDRHYRYKVFQTVVPLRNMIWKP